MNSQQALELFAQIINQVKFTLAEGEQVKAAFQILNQLVVDSNTVPELAKEDGNKDK